MKNQLLLVLLMFCSLVVYSQDSNDLKVSDEVKKNFVKPIQKKAPGYINLMVPSSIEVLVGKNRYVNQQKSQMEGFRIQLMQSTDKSKVLNTRASFSRNHPGIPMYFDYVQPYFKLRIGNFGTRIEAYRFYINIRGDYTSAFIVKENIPKNLVYTF